MKDDRIYLQHIREALQDIAGYCGSDHGAVTPSNTVLCWKRDGRDGPEATARFPD